MTELYVPQQVKIDKIITETADTKRFRLAWSVPHQPGQFVQMSLFGIGEAPISVCSSSSDSVELCVRNVGNVTNALFSMKEGGKVGVRGPYGNGYPMHEFRGKNILVIAGGTGVAPVRGVLKYLEDHQKEYGNVDIFVGFRSPADILFKKDIEHWKDLFSFNITVDKPDEGWKGSVGVITSLLSQAQLKRLNSVVLTCGPPIMIKFVIQDLLEMGFDEQQIWVSLERMMKCGVGKCGHCMVQDKYVCRDGPVFNYLEAKNLED
jgi:anaerobic sulfite reductase subunit B